MTEKEKMVSGYLFDASDKELSKLWKNSHELCLRYNALPEHRNKARKKILKKLLPNVDPSAFIQGPVFVDCGENIRAGKNLFANFNLTILDNAPVTIGDNVMIGPNCAFVTPVHPLLPQERSVHEKQDGTAYDMEYARPITIGNDCWIATAVTVIGGVKIGNGCVIGAGSVVTKDIPDNCIAVGNPCHVVRQIDEHDSTSFKPNLQKN